MRETLIEVYLDWRNNYLTVGRYAECNALTTEQASKLIALAREVFDSIHPWAWTMTNFSLAERMLYAPETFSNDELIDLLGELDAWRAMSDSDSPEAFSKSLESNHEQHNEIERDLCNWRDAASDFDLTDHYQLSDYLQKADRVKSILESYDVANIDQLIDRLEEHYK